MTHKVTFLDHTADPSLITLKCECSLAPGCTSEIYSAELPISEGLRALARALVTELEALFTPSAAQANSLPNDVCWCGRYLKLPLAMVEEIDWSTKIVLSIRCPILDIEPSLPTTVGDDFCIASKLMAYRVRSRNGPYMEKRSHASEATALA